MRVVDKNGRTIDYRLNILGVRVWEHSCQLISKGSEGWTALGPRWDLPVQVPRNDDELKMASADTVRLTAYQYDAERPGSDIVAVLNRSKDFSAALGEHPAAVA